MKIQCCETFTAIPLIIPKDMAGRSVGNFRKQIKDFIKEGRSHFMKKNRDLVVFLTVLPRTSTSSLFYRKNGHRSLKKLQKYKFID